MRSSRTTLIIAVVLLVVILGGAAYYVSTEGSGPTYSSTSRIEDSSSTQGFNVIASNFRVLSQSHTDVCAYIGDQQANTNYINSLPDNYYLQGSCCTPMDYSHYVSQIGALWGYSNIPIIPLDPYNVSAPLAKQMISYDGLALTSAQQAVYDGAMKASTEGPCCCQCWAWYAHEGLAKALIRQYGWNAQQIANIWQLEDCCGGP
jgi:hypothetical protein